MKSIGRENHGVTRKFTPFLLECTGSSCAEDPLADNLSLQMVPLEIISKSAASDRNPQVCQFIGQFVVYLLVTSEEDL
jgi:hypothetical protein